jgi:hypothetical protein
MVPWAIVGAVVLVTILIAFALVRIGVRKKAPKSTDRVPISPAAGKTLTHVVERRRSQRTACRVHVFVYGHARGEEGPFYEEAATFEVSAHGGLLAITANVAVGQPLLLTNMASHEDQECRVVRCVHNNQPKCDVAFELVQPNPTFWQTPPVCSESSGS